MHTVKQRVVQTYGVCKTRFRVGHPPRQLRVVYELYYLQITKHFKHILLNSSDIIIVKLLSKQLPILKHMQRND